MQKIFLEVFFRPEAELIGQSFTAIMHSAFRTQKGPRIDADNISYVTPRGGPGQIAAIYIKKGDMVRKGQPVLKLDDRIILQQIEQLKTQLSFANDLLQRRENLWKQNIGSEVELLSAKNNVTQLERQISTLREQWSMTNVVAEVSGYVDDVMVRVGEIFQGPP